MTIPTYMSGILFTKAHKVVRARIFDVLDKYGLNPTYWSILGATIGAADGVRLSTVAKMLGVKAPMVTMMVDDLSQKGLLRRIPHHTDKRAKLLVMTPKGKKLAKQIEEDLNKEIHSILKGIGREEIVTFQKVLETIIANSGE